MKKCILFLLLLGSSVSLLAQGWLRSPAELPFVCAATEYSAAAGCSPAGPVSSVNGKVFTPKGDLRILVIYAGFNNIVQSIRAGDQPLSGWPVLFSDVENITRAIDIKVPTYLDSISGAMPGVFFGDTSEFAVYCIPADTTNKSLSRYYYDMSRGKFRIMADAYKDPVTGKPARINIDPSGATEWADLNRKVILQMKAQDPGFDWSPYDKRTNWPYYQCDNSLSSPDGKPDYVVIVYRWSSAWGVQPLSGMSDWVGSGGAYSVLDGLDTISYNGYSFDDAGYTLPNGGGNGIGGFVHELAHELFSAPHIMGANGEPGAYFHTPSAGWGMATTTVTNLSANAWERWLLGWSENRANFVNANIESQGAIQNGGVYTLQDFITTGDAMRIRIPGSTQYLWIENHQKKSLWDHNPWAGDVQSLKGEIIPDMEKGIYMYVEDILPARSGISQNMIASKVNGLKVINAQGNYDYTRSAAGSRSPAYYWGNMLYDFKRDRDNPLGGTNPLLMFSDDFPNESTGLTNDTIGYKEYYYIVRETNGTDTNLLYANTGGVNTEAKTIFNRRSDAFQVGDEINMATNPTVVNYASYDQVAKVWQPVQLNGLSVKILSQSGDNMTIRISLNNTDVDTNARWAGKIELGNISGNANVDLNLAPGKTITIDRSRTNNLSTRTSDGYFADSSSFTCKDAAYVHMNSGSAIVVDEKSSFNMKNTSRLIIGTGATFRVKNNSILSLANDAEIYIKEGGNLIFESGGKLILDNNARIVLEEPSTLAATSPLLELSGGAFAEMKGSSMLELKENAQLMIRGKSSLVVQPSAEMRFGYGALSIDLQNAESCLELKGKVRIADNTTFATKGDGFIQIPQSTMEWIPGVSSSVRIIANNNQQKVLRISNSSAFKFPKELEKLTITKGTVTLDTLSVMDVACAVRLTLVTFTSSDSLLNNHRGLRLHNQGGVMINSCTFENGYYGIHSMGQSQPNRKPKRLYAVSSTFKNCKIGIRQHDAGFDLSGCNFYNNEVGIYTSSLETDAQIRNCFFDNRNGLSYATGIIQEGTGTSSVWIDGSTITNNGGQGIFGMGNMPVNIKCSMVDSNGSGIELYTDASLNMSSQMDRQGNVSFTGNIQDILLQQAQNIFLGEGYNYFHTSSGIPGNIISGSINRPALDTIFAYGNNWKNTGYGPVIETDYNIRTMDWTSDIVYLEDPDPFTGLAECEDLVPCNSCAAVNKNPLLYCEECIPITTSHFSAVQLHDALQDVLGNISTGDQATAYAQLKEILTYPVTAISSNERYILRYAYRTMKGLFAACLTDSNYVYDDSPYLADFTSDLIDVIEHQKRVSDSALLFEDPSVLKLDLALLYKTLGELNDAGTIVEALLTEVDPAKIPYIAYWDCLIRNEQDLAAERIDDQAFLENIRICHDTYVYDIENLSLRPTSSARMYQPSGHVSGETGEDMPLKKSVTNPEQFVIYPNPSSGLFILLLPEHTAFAKIMVSDIYGRSIKEYTTRSNRSFEIDLSDMPDGYYVCTIVSDQERFTKKLLKGTK